MTNDVINPIIVAKSKVNNRDFLSKTDSSNMLHKTHSRYRNVQISLTKIGRISDKTIAQLFCTTKNLYGSQESKRD